MGEKTTIQARELMRTDVVRLAPDDTIESAIRLFEEARVRGVHVVDGGGALIGVLSLSDITRSEHASGDLIATRRENELAEPVGEELGEELDPAAVIYSKEDYSAELLGRDLVGDWMTREVISVSPQSSLQEVCTAMVNQHIHRVFVTEGEKLAGVISSFDVVRHVAGNGKAPRRRA